MWRIIKLKFLPAGLFILLASLLLSSISKQNEAESEWGFFGHRRINRMAVFTLPVEMMPFFRHHLEYLTDHAVILAQMEDGKILEVEGL